MTPSSRKGARRATVALTRHQVEMILVHHMGWEHEDVTTFWRVALRESREPGYIARRSNKLWAKFLRHDG
jgi:hypothetical protein